jgi:hypothetical protein
VLSPKLSHLAGLDLPLMFRSSSLYLCQSDAMQHSLTFRFTSTLCHIQSGHINDFLSRLYLFCQHLSKKPSNPPSKSRNLDLSYCRSPKMLNKWDLVYWMPLPEEWPFIPPEQQDWIKRGASRYTIVPLNLCFLCTGHSNLQITCEIPTVTKTFISQNGMDLRMSLKEEEAIMLS